ncbi:MAG: VOC family protein [Candidatus Eremiobacteraeota bacterium]|nr:VOC family protein [Candidatus Eremiobacteraeota bacterium]
MNIKHLHLHVKNRSESEQFYEAWLGLRIARRGKVITFMTDDSGFDLALMDDPAPGSMPQWFHFGTRVESSDAVSTLHQEMRQAAVPIAKPLFQDETMSSFRCVDPDGYAIEVYWEAESAPLD